MTYKDVTKEQAAHIREWTLVHSGFGEDYYYRLFPNDRKTEKQTSTWQKIRCFWRHLHNYEPVALNHKLRGYAECTLCGKRKDFWFRDTPFSHMD